MPAKPFQPKRLAPLLAGLTLIAAAGWLVRQLDRDIQDAPPEYLANTAESIQAIPYKIGPYLGRDAAVSRSAIELLKPNVVLQRHYIHEHDPDLNFSFLFVHCGLTRDMEGHYPPVCYPAHGWTLEHERPADLRWTDSTIPARRYVIARGEGLGEQRRVIYNFFVLPSEDRSFAANMDELRSVDVKRSRLFEGVGQVQLLFDQSVPEPTRRDVVDLVLNAARPAIRRTTGGLATGGLG